MDIIMAKILGQYMGELELQLGLRTNPKNSIFIKKNNNKIT